MNEFQAGTKRGATGPSFILRYKSAFACGAGYEFIPVDGL